MTDFCVVFFNNLRSKPLVIAVELFLFPEAAVRDSREEDLCFLDLQLLTVLITSMLAVFSQEREKSSLQSYDGNNHAILLLLMMY